MADCQMNERISKEVSSGSRGTLAHEWLYPGILCKCRFQQEPLHCRRSQDQVLGQLYVSRPVTYRELLASLVRMPSLWDSQKAVPITLVTSLWSPNSPDTSGGLQTHAVLDKTSPLNRRGTMISFLASENRSGSWKFVGRSYYLPLYEI